MTTDHSETRVAVITGASSESAQLPLVLSQPTASGSPSWPAESTVSMRWLRSLARDRSLSRRTSRIEARLLAAAERVKSELGRVDVLMNNAGVMLLGPFTSDQREEQQQMVEVNLLGAMTTTEVFLDQPRTEGAISSTSRRWRDVRLDRAMPRTQPPSGVSTAGRSPSVKSYSPMCASW